MLQDTSLLLVESLDLGPILTGAATTVTNEMATCSLDMEKLCVDIQTLNRQPLFFGYLAFMAGWLRAQSEIDQRLSVPDDVAARCTVLGCVADYLAQTFATEDA